MRLNYSRVSPAVRQRGAVFDNVLLFVGSGIRFYFELVFHVA